MTIYAIMPTNRERKKTKTTFAEKQVKLRTWSFFQYENKINDIRYNFGKLLIKSLNNLKIKTVQPAENS